MVLTAGSTATGGASPSCAVANNEIGHRTTHDYGINIANGGATCSLYSADCSGTLEVGYVYHMSDDTENVKICVYADAGTDDVPDVLDTKVACSNAISGTNTTTWENSDASLTGSVTAGTNNYWICLVSDSTVWTNGFASTGTSKRYTNSSFNYTTPPDNLDGTWTLGDSSSELSAYVRIE